MHLQGGWCWGSCRLGCWLPLPLCWVQTPRGHLWADWGFLAAYDFLDAAQSSKDKCPEREPSGGCVTFPNLILEVTEHHFCCLLLEASH